MSRKSLNQVAYQRNVQHFDSIGVPLPLGEMTVDELFLLEDNLNHRYDESNHDWKDEHLENDLNKVFGELAARGIVELAEVIEFPHRGDIDPIVA